MYMVCSKYLLVALIDICIYCYCWHFINPALLVGINMLSRFLNIAFADYFKFSFQLGV